MEWQTNVIFDEDVVNEAIEALSLSHRYKTFFIHHVFPDLKDISCLSEREKFRKYACLLQKQYPCTSEIKEIHINRIIKYVFPRMLLQSTAEKEIEKEISVSQSDRDIVQYLCGAILKWGINKLPEQQSNWCKAQVSTTNKLPAHFQKLDRGLIVPNTAFFNLILQCETNFRKLKKKKKISTPSIINSVIQQGISINNPNESAIKKLLGRYIRMRAHISTKHDEKLSQQQKQRKKLETRSLRV